uniref:Dynein cytoplasmic 1 intermediate chain 1 n=1 Tax=Poecilia mexicana TaxID=48701 RepID=A0A3B3YU32_9TELE
MSDKSDLKAELERKKQRLAQIREEKKRKEEERKKKESDSQQKTEVTPEDSDLDRKRRETEALLQSIGISPEPPLGTWYSKGFHSVVFRLDLKDQQSAVSRPSPPRSSLVLS